MDDWTGACVDGGVAGKNLYGVAVYDEEIFATERVQHVGQIIGVVVATSRR